MKFYDKDKDLALRFQEFVEILLTRTDTELRSIITQRNPYKVRKTDSLSRELEYELVKLLQLEFNLISEIYVKSESLKYLFGFEIRKAFNEIDRFRQGFINENDLFEFIKSHFKLISNNDARILLNRIDFDGDGRINFLDFSTFMEMGKYNNINNNVKMNRLNYSSYSNFKNDENNNFNRSYNSFREFEKSPENKNAKENKFDYKNLSYKEGKDYDIDELRYHNTNLKNLNLSKDINFGVNQGNGTNDLNIMKKYDEIPNQEKNKLINKNPNLLNISDSREKNIQEKIEENNEIKSIKNKNEEKLIIENNKYNKNINDIEQNFSENKQTNSHYGLSSFANNNMNKESFLDLSFYNSIGDGVSLYANFLKEFIKIDQKLERLKEKLAFCEDLEISEIFKLFDCNYKGYFIFEELKLGLQNIDIIVDLETIKNLFKFIDRDADNCITFNEFCEFICPKNHQLNSLFRNRNLENKNIVSIRSTNLLVDFFRLAIDNEMKIQSLKNLAVKKPIFNISHLFNMIKGKIRCFIIREDVRINYIYFLIFSLMNL